MSDKTVQQLNAALPVVFDDGTMQYPFRDFLNALRTRVLQGTDRNVDGGAPDSVYLPSQKLDGGTA